MYLSNSLRKYGVELDYFFEWSYFVQADTFSGNASTCHYLIDKFTINVYIMEEGQSFNFYSFMRP